MKSDSDAEDFNYFRMFRQEESLCNLKTVQYIKAHFSGKDTIHVFDMEGGITNMLPANFVNNNYMYLRDRNKISLSDFLKENKYEIIYKTPTLSMLNSVQKDTVLFDLLKMRFAYFLKQKLTANNLSNVKKAVGVCLFVFGIVMIVRVI